MIERSTGQSLRRAFPPHFHSIVAAFLLAAAYASASYAQDASRKGEQWFQNSQGPAGAPTVQGQPALIEKGEGMSRDFYNPDGSFHHWARGIEKEVYEDFKWTSSIVVITGGYQEIRKQQDDYNHWIREKAAPSTSPSGRRLGCGEDFDSELPCFISANGGLSIRTLRIPYYRLAYDIRREWARFQELCQAADVEQKYPVCSVGLDEFKSSTKYLYPHPAFQILADQIEDAWTTAGKIRVQVDALLPLTERWVRVKDTYEFKSLAVEDHLEPDQLSSDLLRKLAGLEADARKSFNRARILTEDK